MTYNTRGSKQAENSQQGAVGEIQQELQGHRSGTDEKIDKLQEAIELLVTGMQGLLNKTHQRPEDVLNDEEVTPLIVKNKGVFRNPAHAAWERQRREQQHENLDEEEEELEVIGGKEERRETHSLRHLKLSFPVFKEGNDTLEWLRDCEEYFSIFEVNDKRRPAIAAMHLSGIPRSWLSPLWLAEIE